MSREVVKMKQGMSYSCKEKTIILNVFKYFRKIHPDKCITEIVRCTSKATGCSEKSIFRFRKEETSPEGFKEPSKTKVRKNININSRFLKYDESVREAIKFIIYDLKYKNVVPSLSTILKNVNSNEMLPNFSLMTLRRLLFDMGFHYEKEKTTNKPVLVEKSNEDNLKELKKEGTQITNEVQDMKPNITGKIPQSVNNKLKNPASTSDIIPLNSENIHQNHMSYVSNQSHRHIPMTLGYHENHIVEGMPIGLQHTMMLSHRMSHPIHPIPHSMGFMHHAPHSQNLVTQQ